MDQKRALAHLSSLPPHGAADLRGLLKGIVVLGAGEDGGFFIERSSP